MDTSIYENIAARTGGNIYIGVVGPVRTGKSTFIKRFMDTLVLPNITDDNMQKRARDELPQSGSGKTIMTAEPKFVPEQAVEMSFGAIKCNVRLIDCVGYLVPGATGGTEGGSTRMVSTPWYDHEIPLSDAAELGTQKVITEHSTVGIVITTDGSVTGIARDAYLDAEARVVAELEAIGKPYVVVVNSREPSGEAACAVRESILEKYGCACVCADCMRLDAEEMGNIIGAVLREFPVTDVCISLPQWTRGIKSDGEIKSELYSYIREHADTLMRMRDLDGFCQKLGDCELISACELTQCNMATGEAIITLDMPKAFYFKTLSDAAGAEITSEGELFDMMAALAQSAREYELLRPALNDCSEHGYGVFLPQTSQLTLSEPEIVRNSGRFGVRLRASASTIHMIRAEVSAEVSPAANLSGGSDDMLSYILQEFDGDKTKIWQSNLFGRSLYDIAGDGLQAKVQALSPETRAKLRDTLEKVVNEGANGLLCIIL